MRAADAARFSLQTGDPRFLRFGEAANVVANEAGVLRAKLAAGDLRAVRVCTAKIGRVVDDIDELEDRLPKRAACGRSLRPARKAADRLADNIEDVFDDLEDEVEDLRFGGRVGFAGYAPRPVRPAPPVVVCPAPGPAGPGPHALPRLLDLPGPELRPRVRDRPPAPRRDPRHAVRRRVRGRVRRPPAAAGSAAARSSAIAKCGTTPAASA